MDVGIPSGMRWLLGQQNFERLFVISWENNRDCHITMPLSLKTMEVQIKGNQWNKRFRAVQVYWKFQVDITEGGGENGGGGADLNVQLTLRGEKVNMSTAPNWKRIIEVSLVTYKLSFKFAETTTMWSDDHGRQCVSVRREADITFLSLYGLHLYTQQYTNVPVPWL